VACVGNLFVTKTQISNIKAHSLENVFCANDIFTLQLFYDANVTISEYIYIYTKGWYVQIGLFIDLVNLFQINKFGYNNMKFKHLI
jgi:hypothetical protein